ncbi:MAG: Integral membrane protein TerC family protein [Methanomassiliicoccales archaeon PtaU1.Bin124]|nr:MAG: Integral membrane protein TerC family protein [Methanomassiliicoccales archaeon PtaU1.Bin124]
MVDQNLIWILFFVFIIAMLALDLGFFNRKAHEIKAKEAVKMWLFWVALAVIFNILVWYWYGGEKALEFTTGYVMEEALSVDNMFVFILIFSYFAVPKEDHHKVLFYGVLGALLFRGLFIFAGIAVVQQFDWVIYIFGAFLIFTAIKIAIKKEDAEVHPDHNIVVRGFRKVFRVTENYEGSKFFVWKKEILMATPLFVALLVVETTDIVFAVDSVPAIIAITQDPFIVYTSNAFAILGLRSLYFLLASVMGLFCYLKYGLAAILAFVGTKMLLASFIHIPVILSLLVIVGILVVTILASLIKNRGKKACPPPEHVN